MQQVDLLFEAFLKHSGQDFSPEMRKNLALLLRPNKGKHAKQPDVIVGTLVQKEPESDGANPIDLDTWRADAERSERMIEAMAAKLEMLACAVGACPSCWGAEGACKGCGGRGNGGPGAFLPDPACFDTFIIPVLHTIVDPEQIAPPLTTRQRGRARARASPVPEPSPLVTIPDAETFPPLTSTET